MHDGTHGVREKQRYPTDKEGCQKPLGESPSLFTTKRMYIWRDPRELEGNYRKNVSGDVKGMRGDCTMSQSIKRMRATKWIQGSVTFEKIHLGAMEERTGHLCQKAQGRARSNALENGTKSKWNEKETCGQLRSQGFPFEKGESPGILQGITGRLLRNSLENKRNITQKREETQRFVQWIHGGGPNMRDQGNEGAIKTAISFVVLKL